MELQHPPFIFNGTPKEFWKRLEDREQAELLHQTDRPVQEYFSRYKPFVYNGLEYKLNSRPIARGTGDIIHRLDYYACGVPVGMSIDEQEERNIFPTKELGLTFELTPRLDGRTDIVATCLHPLYEQEFRAMMASLTTEQHEDTSALPSKHKISKLSPTEQISETNALQDLIDHLEQGLERSEAKEKMSIAENGLKSRQKRLRKLWGMQAGAKWSDYITEAQRRKGLRGA